MVTAAAAAIGRVAYVAAQPAEQSLSIQATKFVFLPEEVTVKRGAPVVLEITNTSDVMMGFNAPDFKVRADLPPGKPVKVRFVAEQTGSFEYLCDIFCGSGHEEMSARIIVVA